jgi:hypothetical protein
MNMQTGFQTPIKDALQEVNSHNKNNWKIMIFRISRNLTKNKFQTWLRADL